MNIIMKESIDADDVLLKANNGDKEAQYIAGYLYEDGELLGQNYAESIKYYTLSADQGFPPAQNDLGVQYEHGCENILPQDYKKASELYSKAMEGDYLESFHNMAVLCEKGLGIGRDYNKAIK